MKERLCDQVPKSDEHTVRINIGGTDPLALRFLTSDDKVGQVFDVYYGGYVHQMTLSPTGKKAKVWSSKRI